MTETTDVNGDNTGFVDSIDGSSENISGGFEREFEQYSVDGGEFRRLFGENLLVSLAIPTVIFFVGAIGFFQFSTEFGIETTLTGLEYILLGVISVLFGGVVAMFGMGGMLDPVVMDAWGLLGDGRKMMVQRMDDVDATIWIERSGINSVRVWVVSDGETVDEVTHNISHTHQSVYVTDSDGVEWAFSVWDQKSGYGIMWELRGVSDSVTFGIPE